MRRPTTSDHPRLWPDLWQHRGWPHPSDRVRGGRTTRCIWGRPERPLRPGPWESGRIDVQGHRGARGLVVENVVPSFLAAFEAGCSGVELDVRLTADGEVVVWHDPTLQPDKCRGDHVGARVDELTLEQLRTVDVGSRTVPDTPEQRAVPGARIPTLREVLAAGAASAPNAWWTIELKVDPTDEREVATRDRLVDGVVQVVEEAGIGRRCFIHSFDWAVLERSREVAPALLRSALVIPGSTYRPGSPWTGTVAWEDHGDDVVSAVTELGAVVVAPSYEACDATLVDAAHDAGIAVLPWTVNDDAALEAMLALGVDGIVTDHPDRALALVGGRSTVGDQPSRRSSSERTGAYARSR